MLLAKTRSRTLLAIALSVSAMSPARAAGQPERALNQAGDELQAQVFEFPEIQAHSAELRLSGDQLSRLQREAQAYATAVRALRPIMAAARDELAARLRAVPADERQVEAALASELKVEDQIKQSHIQSLVRLKNTLTVDQIEQLQRLRANEQARGGQR